MEIVLITSFVALLIVAAIAWFAAMYCFIRAWLVRPPGTWNVPIAATDPSAITEAGRKWRRRYYFSCLLFLGVWCVLLALMLSLQ
jgi:hypothetical protein